MLRYCIDCIDNCLWLSYEGFDSLWKPVVSLHGCLQTGSEIHLASYPVETEGYLAGGKGAEW
jgi:hypothetical protein